MAANFAAQKYFDMTPTLFSYQLIGLTRKVRAYNGCQIDSVTKIQECSRPDIVILPGAFESVLTPAKSRELLDSMIPLFNTLRSWHQAGTIMASVCTGNFILSSAQITMGRTLTCHWTSLESANILFPGETFDVSKLLIDHGDVISAGGATAVSQLVLYLVSRFHSRELALATGKLMMIELNLDHQSRFAIFRPRHDHGDALVAKLQQHIESQFNEAPDVDKFASVQGIGLRQLTRRFKKATGETPLSYLQQFRVEQVKIDLESTAVSINTLVWNAGYDDLSSFRRLFKRYTGLTMQEYRSRFSSTL